MGQWQLYHSTGRLAAAFEVTERTVRDWVRSGRFGGDWITLPNGELRVPGSGVDFFCANLAGDQVKQDGPVAARTRGELIRKEASNGKG